NVTRADGLGVPVSTVALWAPACTIDFFRRDYEPSIRNGTIAAFTLFTLTDEAEQEDNCANIYNKSLLYLVSHALEERWRIPGIPKFPGEPILGMECWIRKDKPLETLLENDP